MSKTEELLLLLVFLPIIAKIFVRKTYYGDYEHTKKTSQLIRNLILSNNGTNAYELIKKIKEIGSLIEKRLPKETSVLNVIRHILKIIRVEFNLKCKTSNSAIKLNQSEQDENRYKENIDNLHESILDHLSEFELELETCITDIAEQSYEHIHNSDLILTFGASKLVECFLKVAAKKRQFHVILVQNDSDSDLSALKDSLTQSKITVTIVQCAAIFAMMSRVNSVIIGTHMVLADGGLRTYCGTNMIALSAKHYSVPVIVLATSYEFSPLFLSSYESNAFHTFESSLAVLNDDGFDDVQVYNPVFEYVSPNLITLYVMQQGSMVSSGIYRLLNELYDVNDTKFDAT